MFLGRFFVGCFLVVAVSWQALANPEVSAAEDPQSPEGQSTPKTLLMGGGTLMNELLKGILVKVEWAISQLDIEVARVNLPIKRSLQMAASGRIDGVYIRRDGEEDIYDNLVKIDVPIMVVSGWVWVHPDSSCPSSKQALRQMSTVDVVGFGFLEQVELFKGLRRDSVSDIRAAFKVLQSKRIDYFTVSQGAAGYYQEELDTAFKRCFDEPLYQITNYTFLHKKHQALVPRLEKIYRDVFPNPSH